MKKYLQILLLLSIFSSSLFAEIDERQIDLYFANGMFGNDKLTEKKDWDDYVEDLKAHNPNINEKVLPQLSFNSHALWGADDAIEVIFQKLAGDTISWAKTQDYLQDYIVDNDILEKVNLLAQSFNIQDLATQVNSYKKSINSGHGVIVVAHSQGNFFTNKAYEYLVPWQRNYFQMIGVASPSSIVAGDGLRVSFDNDPVALISGKTTITNQHRNIVAGLDLPSLAFHGFNYYMGVKVSVNDQQVSTTQAYHAISGGILSMIEQHCLAPSQWQKTTTPDNMTDIPEACINRDSCDKKAYYVKHISNTREMNSLMGQTKVLVFQESGKLYQLSGRYIKAPCGAKEVKENPRDGVCFALDNPSLEIEGEGVAPSSVKAKNGAIESLISWNYGSDIDMNLDMSGPNVSQDIKDVAGLSMEHAYVESQFDIYPGDMFDISASGNKKAESTLPEWCLDENPAKIYAMVKTPGGSKFKQYQAKNFAALNLGKFAEIEVKEKEYDPVFSDPTFSTSSGYSGTSVRTYNQCSQSSKKESCGCVPCEYIIRGMSSTVEYGPIGGAEVTIVKANDFGDNSAEVIFRGETSTHDDIFKAGLIEFTNADKSKFDDATYYVVSAKGGFDLDRDDDLVRDNIPTKNDGTIHAILKGSDLKTVSFRVNVLTEAAFQVSGDLLGAGYNAQLLEEKLNNIATKLIKQKTYVLNGELGINYHDVLLWAPGVDKPLLFKDYDTFVEPIVLKTYADQERFDESYKLIYEPIDPNAPLLTPMALTIPYNLPSGTIIGKVGITNEGNTPIVSMNIKGENSEAFSIDAQGVIRLENMELVVNTAQYTLQMNAVNEAGLEGIYVGLMIEVNGELNLADPNASIPYLESIDTKKIDENPSVGTVIASVTFKDDAQTIVDYNISGMYKDAVEIDSSGNIKVLDPLVFDYEKATVYEFRISAINDVQNEGYATSFSINVENVIDTPLYELVFFKHIEENKARGTVIGKIQQLREGLSPVERFDILNPNVPFSIDVDGVVYTSGPIDYETLDFYDLTAIARTPHGDSNKVDIQIYVDNQYPEIGIPLLNNKEFSILENVQAPYIVGSLDINDSGYSIEKIVVSGDDAHHFNIGLDGTISLENNVSIDYEKKSAYQLHIKALNSVGYSKEGLLSILVENQLDAVPVLENIVLYVDENISLGSKIGELIKRYPGEAVINNYVLIGDLNQTIQFEQDGSLSMIAPLDYESNTTLQGEVYVDTEFGESNKANVIINVNNIDEKPMLVKIAPINILEHSNIGTVVTNIIMQNSEDSPIDTMLLSGIGSDNFDVDGNQIILANNLNFYLQNHFELQVSAHNTQGYSKAIDLNISVLQTIYTGTDNSENIYGSELSEEFNGAKGNDQIFGGAGDDIYHYTYGDGNDTIIDAEGYDKLFLHNIDKSNISFVLTSSDLLVQVDQNGSYIGISNWKENNCKIEEIIFDNGEIIYAVEFKQPFVTPDVGVVDISKLNNAQATQVAQGRIIQLNNSFNSVDHWEFYFQGGNLIIDILSELASNGQNYIDLDGNNKQDGVDIYIYFYKKNSNGEWNLIASNDDSGSGRADGSSHSYDSYLSLSLDEGEYLLAVGSFPLTSSEALSGQNNDVENGPYQITLNQNVEFSSIPESAIDNLYGGDHYNFFVLRDDIDGYNMEPLSIQNTQILDENGTAIFNKGYVEATNGYLSYYPEDRYSNLADADKINIAYDVVDKHDIVKRSLLTLYIISSHYIHVTPIIDYNLFESINSLQENDLNVTYRP